MAETLNEKLGLIKGLTDILALQGLIDPADVPALNQEYEEQKENLSFEEFLVQEQIITKPELLEALSQYYELPALDVIGEFFDHHFLTQIPKSVLINNAVIPYNREGDLLTVVAAQPDNPELLPTLAKHISHEISFMVGYAPDIIETIDEFYDEPIVYQPNNITNERMERSSMKVHPTGEEMKVKDHEDERIPLAYEETNDDYEGR